MGGREGGWEGREKNRHISDERLVFKVDVQ